MVTSKDSEIDEILALSYGADDYITKPYNPTILLLHIEAVFKRLHKAEPKLTYQNIRVNLMKSTLEKMIRNYCYLKMRWEFFIIFL